MGIIKSNHKVASIVHHSHFLLPVLNRFGIRLGVKDKTIQEVCDEKAINLHFVLAILNAYHNNEYFPKDELLNIDVKTIVAYLHKTHDYYVNYVLNNIDGMLHRLLTSAGDRDKELQIIHTFYHKYKDELINHINDEEQNVFPYVLQLEEAVNNKLDIDFGDNSITEFEKEHSNVDEKLNDLKNLIIKYVEPVYDDNACNEFLSAIFQFEKDLLDHSRIEDLILVPIVLNLEKIYHGR